MTNLTATTKTPDKEINITNRKHYKNGVQFGKRSQSMLSQHTFLSSKKTNKLQSKTVPVAGLK